MMTGKQQHTRCLPCIVLLLQEEQGSVGQKKPVFSFGVVEVKIQNTSQKMRSIT